MSENNGGLPEGYQDLSESTALARGATVGPCGETQTAPVWSGWDGEHLESGRTEVRHKLHNVGRDPRIRLSNVEPENPYPYLEVRGEEDPDRDPFIDSPVEKYPGRGVYPDGRTGGERVVVCVAPCHKTRMGA